MKRIRFNFYIASVLLIIIISLILTNCKKTENPIKFPLGSFPDSVVALDKFNSAYDDYNLSIYQIQGSTSLIFSSNRQSSGGQFDLEQANIAFTFDQTTGVFGIAADMMNDPFIAKLINQAKTAGNDFGPYRLYSSLDGFEYLILSSVNADGNLDLYYLKNIPVFNLTSLPDIDGPHPVTLLNTNSNDAYISLNSKLDTAYFTSDRNGNFDIFLQKKPENTELSKWFASEFNSSVAVDSVNSIYDDKCPMVFKNILIFTSNRQGGLGGFDLYYSIFRNGKWSYPENMGPGINSSSDEYRPVIGYHPEFTNQFIMFSSDRPGGKGGFDLYFTGYTFPDK